MLLFCCYADRIGHLLGVMDRPDGGRKAHPRPTPLIGGIALMLPLSWVTLTQWLYQPSAADMALVLIVAGMGFTVLGWLDDRRHVAPLARLVGSTALCGALLIVEPDLSLRALDLGPLVIPLGVLAVPFTLLCLVGLQNAINMADGLDGLVIALCSFWTVGLLLYAPPSLAVYLICLLIGLLILLPFNLAGRLFLGDSGSYSLGAVIGVLMIHVHHHAAGSLPADTIVLWLLVPVLDCLRVMAARVLAGRSPLMPDRNHLHHRLSERWSHRRALGLYLALVVVPGTTVALLPQTTFALLLLALSAYLVVLWQTRPASSPSDPRPAGVVAAVVGGPQRAK